MSEKKPKIVGKCPMCTETAQFVDSHIVPHAFYKIDKNTKLLGFNENARVKRFIPKGVYDQIICSGCESMFGDTDNYAIKTFLHGKFGILGKPMRVVLPNADYGRLKLFAMDVVYRAHLSQRPECSTAKLQHDQLAILHDLVLQRDPGPESYFPVQFKYYYDFPALFVRLPKWVIQNRFLEFQINNVVVQMRTIVSGNDFTINTGHNRPGRGISVSSMKFLGSRAEKLCRKFIMAEENRRIILVR